MACKRSIISEAQGRSRPFDGIYHIEAKFAPTVRVSKMRISAFGKLLPCGQRERTVRSHRSKMQRQDGIGLGQLLAKGFTSRPAAGAVLGNCGDVLSRRMNSA